MEKVQWSFPGCHIENTRKNFKLNLILVLVLKSKALYFPTQGTRLQNRPFSLFHLSLHALKEWWDKSNITWFLRWQTNIKIAFKKIAVEYVYSSQPKMEKNYIFKRTMANGGWIIVTFLNAVAIIDVLPPNRNNDNSHWPILWLACPPEIPRDINFLPPILKLK